MSFSLPEDSACFFTRPLPVSTNKSSPLYKNYRNPSSPLFENYCAVHKCMNHSSRNAKNASDDAEQQHREQVQEDANVFAAHTSTKMGMSAVLGHLDDMMAPLVEETGRLGLRWRAGNTASIRDRLHLVGDLFLPPGFSFQMLIDMGIARVFFIAIFADGMDAHRVDTIANTRGLGDNGSVSRGTGCNGADGIPRLLYFVDFHPVIFEMELRKTDFDVSTDAGKAALEKAMMELVEKTKAKMGERASVSVAE